MINEINQATELCSPEVIKKTTRRELVQILFYHLESLTQKPKRKHVKKAISMLEKRYPILKHYSATLMKSFQQKIYDKSRSRRREMSKVKVINTPLPDKEQTTDAASYTNVLLSYSHLQSSACTQCV